MISSQEKQALFAVFTIISTGNLPMVLVAGGAGKIPLALDLEIEQVQQVIEGQN